MNDTWHVGQIVKVNTFDKGYQNVKKLLTDFDFSGEDTIVHIDDNVPDLEIICERFGRMSKNWLLRKGIDYDIE